MISVRFTPLTDLKVESIVGYLNEIVTNHRLKNYTMFRATEIEMAALHQMGKEISRLIVGDYDLYVTVYQNILMYYVIGDGHFDQPVYDLEAKLKPIAERYRQQEVRE